MMARDGFKAMDSDMHVIEPPDLWQRYTEPAFKDRAPKGFERWMGDMQIELEGCLMPTEPEEWATDKAQEQDDIYRHSHENVWDPASQVRAMDLELKAVFIRPNIVNERNWHDPYYDPLWAEIESLGIPLGFHEGSNANMNQVGNRFSTYMMFHTCCHPMEMMLSVVDMIGGGVFERFPNLQVGFLEGNCAWAPWLLWRLNEHFELSGRFESPNLKLEPTDYFKRQGYVSVEPDGEPA
ncbi:MAG: amidohydrolase family protein, partial [Chloroflexi bacterium]|nr:amidohydrolase family protein [Chloroflexota bacterium]